MKEKIFCSVIGTIGGVIAYLLGGFDAALIALVAAMGVDYISGLIAGVFKKSPKTQTGALESRVGLKGLFRKGGVLAIVIVANILDQLTGSSFIRDAIIIAYITNEIISVTENVGLMGVPIHPQIKKAIDILKSKSESGDKPNDT